MPTTKDGQNILNACKDFAYDIGLTSGLKTDISNLELDFVSPPNDFLGIDNNPAIFVNEDTYKFLKKHHPNWKLNNTIAVKNEVLTDISMMNLIGIIAHEAGHAFHVAAEQPNTEHNAYIFEVEILLHWFNSNHPIMTNISQDNLIDYFESRKPYYKKGISLHESTDDIEVTIRLPSEKLLRQATGKQKTRPEPTGRTCVSEASIFPPSKPVFMPRTRDSFLEHNRQFLNSDASAKPAGKKFTAQAENSILLKIKFP